MTELLVPADPSISPEPAERLARRTKPLTRHLALGVDLTGLGAGPTPWAPQSEEARAEIDSQRVVDVARLAQRGVLDFVAFDDEFALAYSPVRSAASRLDAARIACRLAPVTTGVGLVATLDTSYLDPIHVATALSTLHDKSGGRAGWQVGASQPRLLGHATEAWARLEREIQTVARSRTARTSGGVAPWLVVRVDSPAAVAVAGAHADVVRIEALDAEHARSLRRDVRAAAVAAGRDPDDLRVLVDVVAIISSDAAAARARRDLLDDLASAEPAWHRTLSHLGSAGQLVDLLEAWVSDEVVDGFTVLPGSVPHDVRALVSEAVPGLQERGLARAGY